MSLVHGDSPRTEKLSITITVHIFSSNSFVVDAGQNGEELQLGISWTDCNFHFPYSFTPTSLLHYHKEEIVNYFIPCNPFPAQYPVTYIEPCRSTTQCNLVIEIDKRQKCTCHEVAVIGSISHRFINLRLAHTPNAWWYQDVEQSYIQDGTTSLSASSTAS